MALPGLVHRDRASFAFSFDAPTYTKLVTDTLGTHGLPGDDLEVAQQELSDLMDAYLADVAVTEAQFPLPDPSGHPIELASWAVLQAEIDVASATELAIGASFDFLAATFGVWSILSGLFNSIIYSINTLFSVVAVLESQIYGSGTTISPTTGFGPIEL
jgi:hypothetical protein